MLQREVADRIEAKPGTKDYGVLSIFVQLHADVRRVLSLPPGAFRPAPKVRSAVTRFTFRPPAVTLARRGGIQRDGQVDVHAAAKDTLERAGAIRRRRWELRGTRPCAPPASTANAEPKRCNSQNWLGLRTISLLPKTELCYSLPAVPVAVLRISA